MIFNNVISKFPQFLAHLKPIICPAPKFHDAGLLVEGEILDVHLTRRVVDRRWLPLKYKLKLGDGREGERGLKISDKIHDKNLRLLLECMSPQTL